MSSGARALRRFELFHFGLFTLALRRSARPAIWIVWCLAMLVLARQNWAASIVLLDGGLARDAVERGLTRQGLWTGACLVLSPLLVLRAARVVGDWRRGEVDWLASRAVGRTAILFSTWLGASSAGVLLSLATFVFIELRVGGAGPSWALAGEVAMPIQGWIGNAQPAKAVIDDPRATQGTRLHIDLGLGAGAGPAAEVIGRMRRTTAGAGSNDQESSVHTRIATQGSIEIEVPRGAGAIEVSLACAESGARVFVLSKTAELWRPIASDRSAGCAIFVRVAIALAAWLALAIGLGASMSATTAVALLLVLLSAQWLAAVPSPFVPGADLPFALAIIGTGRVPKAIDLRTLAGACACVAIGLSLARLGLRRWRSGA